MKKLSILVIALISSFCLYSQVEKNKTKPDGYIPGPYQNNVNSGKEVQESCQNRYKNSSKDIKYRQIATMNKMLNNEGILDSYDSTFIQYLFNDFTSEYTGFLRDIFHWVNNFRTIFTYDQFYNKIKIESLGFNGLNWSPSSRIICTYNANNQKTSQIQQISRDTLTGTLLNNDRLIYEYDNNGFLSIYTQQSWYSNVWNSYYRYVLINNDSGKVLTNITQTYDSPNSRWKNGGKNENSYDAQNNQLSSYQYRWNTSTLLWDSNSVNLYTYDLNSNMLSKEYQYWSAGVRVISYKYSYTYDGNNNKITELYQAWDNTLAQWINKTKHEYTYNSNNSMLSDNSFKWNAGTSVWDNYDRYIYSYNNNNQQVSSLNSQWITGSWIDYQRVLDVYDTNQNKYNEMITNWRPSDSAWVTRASYYYYWEPYVVDQGINENEIKYPVIVYPNPASMMLNIESPFEIKKLDMYNSTGNLILCIKPSESRLNIDLSAFCNGIYFLQLETINGRINKKIQITK